MYVYWMSDGSIDDLDDTASRRLAKAKKLSNRHADRENMVARPGQA
jgi:hypothetical protein